MLCMTHPIWGPTAGWMTRGTASTGCSPPTGSTRWRPQCRQCSARHVSHLSTGSPNRRVTPNNDGSHVCSASDQCGYHPCLPSANAAHDSSDTATYACVGPALVTRSKRSGAYSHPITPPPHCGFGCHRRPGAERRGEPERGVLPLPRYQVAPRNLCTAPTPLFELWLCCSGHSP